MAATSEICCTLFSDPHFSIRDAHLAAGSYDPVRYECPGCNGTSCTKKQLSVHIPDCVLVLEMNISRSQDIQINGRGCNIYSNNPLYAKERREQGIVLRKLDPIDDQKFREAYRVPDGTDYATITNYKRSRCSLPVMAAEESLLGDERPISSSGAVDDGASALTQTGDGHTHRPPASLPPQQGPAISHALLGQDAQTSSGGAINTSTVQPSLTRYGNSFHPPASIPRRPSYAMSSALVGDNISKTAAGAFSTNTSTAQHPPARIRPLQPSVSMPALLSGTVQESVNSTPIDTGSATVPDIAESDTLRTRSPAVRNSSTGALFAVSDFVALANALRASDDTAAQPVTAPHLDMANVRLFGQGNDGGCTLSGNMAPSGNGLPGPAKYYRDALLMTRDPTRPPSPEEISDRQKNALRNVMERQSREG